MSKKLLVDSVAYRAGIADSDARRTVAHLTNNIIFELKGKGKFTWPGIGTLRIHALPEQPSRHPLSGAKIKVPARKGIEFVADRKLKEAL